MSVNTAIVVDKCPEIMANHIRILEEMGLVNVYGAGCMEVADAIDSMDPPIDPNS